MRIGLNDIGYVLLLLTERKDDLISELFPNSVDSYREEWRRRDPAAFWGHLDDGNRALTLGIARRRYSDGREVLFE